MGRFLEPFVVVIESERDRRKSCINVVLCFEPVTIQLKLLSSTFLGAVHCVVQYGSNVWGVCR